MAVRVFEYEVMENSMATSSVPQGAVQGEHNATLIKFKISDILTEKLKALDTQGKTFCYRFDLYDGVGGKRSTDALTFSPGKQDEFSYSVEEWQTRYGGVIRVIFVITLTDEQVTDMELYSYCVKMTLKSLPDADYQEDEGYKSISTLAAVVKANTKKAVDAANAAAEAMKKTETAKASLESGAEIVILGGNAKSRFETDIVIEDSVSQYSENLVKNNAIAKELNNYADKNELNILLDTLKKEIFNNIYPIGSIYISVKDMEPSIVFGGSWERIEGRTLVGVGTVKYTDFTTRETKTVKFDKDETGGEVEHILNTDEMAAHWHKDSVVINDKAHYVRLYKTNAAAGSEWDIFSYSDTVESREYQSGDLYGSTEGKNVPHNNMPPYIAVYMWKRIA